MISICIPTYEMKDKGVEYLEYSFNILYSQTYKDFEIIISDHSIDNNIKNLCEQWSQVFKISYLRNKYKRGNSSANINNAIRNAKGDIIKILFQDDFLYDEYSLEKQVKCFKEKWLVTACCHYNGKEIYNPFYPRYHDQIQYGQNTISSPSVLMFENKDIIEFDENLISLMDVDYYKRLYDKLGLPFICNEITVVNRIHEASVTLSIVHANNSEIHYKEIEYMKNKFKK
jgi:glycosyltransferase involved in cell wall biosynthesis